MPNMTLVTPFLTQPGGVEEAKAALVAGGPRVACVNHPFAANLETDDGRATEALLKAIDIAVSLEARLIYLVSGGRGSLLWEQAAERFAELIAPCIPVAKERGVRLTVETASEFNVDIHMAHTLDDTIRLAEIAGIGVCIELHACWFEASR
jgi:sugar phosphate isomerase/epimerase